MKKRWNFNHIIEHDKIREITVGLYLFVLLLIGLLLQSPKELLEGLMNIFIAPGMLITDYMVVGGVGPTLVNGSVVGFIGLIILKISKVNISGPAIAAVFTMVGFAYFGKNIWSILPLIFGVFLYSKLRKQAFKTYIYPALFGTALAPFVTQVAFGFEWGILGGVFVGICLGLIIPPLASQLLKAHEGYNLYNLGFTAGVTGLLFLSILRGYGYNSEIVSIWGTTFNPIMRMIFIPIFVTMVLLGILFNKGNLKGYKNLVSQPGTLITDFVMLNGFGNTLINMGLVGLVGSLYIELVGGHYNGATVGGLLTMVGFAGFGKHPLNIIPIMFGVWLGSLTNFSIYEANAPGVLLAALFGTTLAPLSGQFGPIIGVLAGFVHLSIVSNVGILHGGLNLYNNGFSGGIVATIFVAVANSLKEDK